VPQSAPRPPGDPFLTPTGSPRPLNTFPAIIAEHLHEGIGAQEVRDAIENPKYLGIGKLFLPDMWLHVCRFADAEWLRQRGHDPATVALKDVPELKPLHDFLNPLVRHFPISNFESEQVVKTITKELLPSQRVLESTASLRTREHHRDPDRRYALTESLRKMAAIDLGHSKSSRVKPKEAPPVIARSESIVGQQDEILASAGVGDGAAEEEGVEEEEDQEGYAEEELRCTKCGKLYQHEGWLRRHEAT
jgi:hypothetical protein